MPGLENFQAWISVDDTTLEEYNIEQTETEAGSRVSCWIASEEGKAFTIAWRDNLRSEASMGRTFVDGQKCGVPKGINKKGYKKDPTKENDTAFQRGTPSSLSSDRQFTFSKVELTDEDRYLAVPSEGLGEIRLEISYIKKHGQTEMEVKNFEGEGKIHETRKQLTPHRTKLGSEIQGERKPILKVKSKGKPKVFVFKYRPIEVLRAMNIAPAMQSSLNSGEQVAIDLTHEVEDNEMQDTTTTATSEQIRTNMVADDDVDMLDDAQVATQLLTVGVEEQKYSEVGGKESKPIVPKVEDVKSDIEVASVQIPFLKQELKKEEPQIDIGSLNSTSSTMSAVFKSDVDVFMKQEDEKPKIEVQIEIKPEVNLECNTILVQQSLEVKEEEGKSAQVPVDIDLTL